MEEIKIYGKSLLYWFLTTNLFSIIFILTLHQTAKIEIDQLGDYQKLISVLSYLVGFYFFEKIMSTKSKIEIKKGNFNIKNIIMYSIILISLSTIGDFISNGLNNLFKLTGFYFKTDNISNTFNADGFMGYLILIIYACLIGPILEELIFRGYTINLFKKYGKNFAIIISAIMFAIMHAEYTQLISAFICGIFLGIIFFKTNDIRVCILCHIINNIMAIIIMYLKINTIYINLFFILLSLIIFIIFNKSREFFKVTKDIKKETFNKKYFLSSFPFILFILLCLLIMLSQIKSI